MLIIHRDGYENMLKAILYLWEKALKCFVQVIHVTSFLKDMGKCHYYFNVRNKTEQVA